MAANALGMVVANDLANGLLKFYVKTGAIFQNVQDRPLLRTLREKKRPFSGGLNIVSDPVQGQFMSDTPGFLVGYSEDDNLTFAQSGSLLRAETTWKEMNAGMEVTWSEMKKDGISVEDHGKQSEHPGADTVRIVTSLLKNRLDDFSESFSRTFNATMWLDGSQDAKAIPGIRSILTDTPNTGTTAGLSRDTYVWWRHRTLIGGNAITPSAENQTLTKTLRSEWRQLTRYGSGPKVALCGSKFIDALELEVHDKGVYTQEGFTNAGKTDIGMAKIGMKNPTGGKVTFEYDPTLDDLGFSKRCYMIDTDRIQWRPMDKEEMKVLIPERPYNLAVFFKTITVTGVIHCRQLNSSGIYEITGI